MKWNWKEADIDVADTSVFDESQVLPEKILCLRYKNCKKRMFDLVLALHHSGRIKTIVAD